MILHYIKLIKPGIIISNLISSIGGFLLASQGHIQYLTILNMSIGIALVIASSCIFNNIIDRDIDSLMQRTKNRILAQKNSISIKKCTIFAIILNIFGLLFLKYTKSLFAILLAIIGFIVYVIIYSLWIKRKSIYSTIIGSIAGSMPPIIGYCTVTNKFDTGALILSLIFIFWQIPHFYSITISRFNDYKIALIPTFFIQKGIQLTKQHMIICIIGFTLATSALTILGYTSIIFIYIMNIANILWLCTGLCQHQLNYNNIIWSKKMFILSIFIIMLLNLLLSVDSYFLNFK